MICGRFAVANYGESPPQIPSIDMESVVMNEVQFLINVMYPAAQAAYSIMNGPATPLTLPAGYAMAGVINADSQQAAPAMAAANPDQQRLANQTVLESSIFGLIAWNATDQTALIAL